MGFLAFSFFAEVWPIHTCFKFVFELQIIEVQSILVYYFFCCSCKCFKFLARVILKLLCTIQGNLLTPVLLSCFSALQMAAAFITNQIEFMIFFALDYREDLITSDSVGNFFDILAII